MTKQEFIRRHSNDQCYAQGVVCDAKQAVYFYTVFWCLGIQYIVSNAAVIPIN